MLSKSNHLSRRFVLQLLGGTGLAIAFSSCRAQTPSTTAPLRIGLNVGNVPWEFENEAGELVGFEVDMIRIIAEQLNRPLEFLDLPFIDLFPSLLSQRIDIAMASITITAERKENFDFAQPYYDSDQSLTAKADSNINRLEQKC
ncbi:ABC transporter substrate-binding protein [Spirulina subsalsa]|uniref:ABC transporter substrate-binding protein n=1 Tax=Spirulina subsalsa TaxID=54311 RepID=UPI0002ECC2A1|nr:ABC transporter substrate-binding protein [Spirulina subsalsa]